MYAPSVSKKHTTGRLFHAHSDEGEVDIQALEIKDGDLVDPDNESEDE